MEDGLVIHFMQLAPSGYELEVFRTLRDTKEKAANFSGVKTGQQVTVTEGDHPVSYVVWNMRDVNDESGEFIERHVVLLPEVQVKQILGEEQITYH
jgi:hypothetical protein